MNGQRHRKSSLTNISDRHLPVVALVGRPNVGKSTVFNRLTRSRRAIIDPTPGMTRDRLYGTIHRDQGSYRLVDTGGIEEQDDMIVNMIRNQTHTAIQEAEVVIFLVDGREGLTIPDEEICRALRMVDKPKFLFVNKMEGKTIDQLDPEFFKLGFKHVLIGSAEHGHGIEPLLETVDEHMLGKWRAPQATPEAEPLRLAIIGRPNVGKSSILNKLLNEERVMVSDVAGTTRDPIDTYLNYKRQPFCIVDTAGIRKRGRIEGSQESLSVMMARRQVEDAHVVAVMIDATDPTAQQDAAIAGIADKAFKPVIVVVNKWDLVEDKETQSTKLFEDRIRRRMKFLETSPFVFVSAKTGQRVTRVLDLALDFRDRMDKRVGTGVLNRFVEDIGKNYRVPRAKGQSIKIYYMTQVETRPPTFVMSTNRDDEPHFHQVRFLKNRLREAFDLSGIPLKLIFKKR